jgi:hypothetical protein
LHAFDVLGDVQFVVELPADDPVSIDDERDAAIDVENGPEDAVEATEPSLGIADHRKGRPDGGCEILLRFRIIDRNADELGAETLNFRVCVAKPRRLECSPLREGFGEEEENDGAPSEIGKANVVSVARGRGEIGSCITDANHLRTKGPRRSAVKS